MLLIIPKLTLCSFLLVLAVQVCAPTSNRLVFSLLPILTSMSHTWIIAIQTSVRLNLKVTLICISLRTKDVEHIFKFSQPNEFLLLRIICLHLYYSFCCIIWFFNIMFLQFFTYFGYYPSIGCKVREKTFPIV